MAIRKQGNVIIMREAIPGESVIFGEADPSGITARYNELVAKGQATAPALFEMGAALNPKAVAIRDMQPSGEFKDITYGEMIEQIRALARSLVEGKFCPEKHDVTGRKLRYLAIFMYNRPEYPICEIGGLFAGAAIATVYEEPHEHCVYMINHMDFDTIIVQPNYANMMAKLMKDKSIRHVNNFIMTDEMDEETKKLVTEQGINVYYLSDLIKKGRELKTELPKLTPDDIFMLAVTSGSTGYPKGVLLGHKSLVYLYLGLHPFHITSEDVMVMNINYAFLSCKALCLITLTHGGQVVCYPHDKPIFYYSQPDRGLVLMKKADPTMTFFTPLYLHAVHQIILDYIRKMPEKDAEQVRKAIEEKIKLMKAKHELHFPELDKYITPVRNAFFGTRLNQTYYVGAKVRDDSLWFIRAVLGCTLQSTYGQTELACLCSTDSPFGDYGRIGTAQSGALAKLVDCPERGFTTKDVIDGKPAPRGELCILSPACFFGYLNDPEKTKESFLPGGWLRTKDIVQLDPEVMDMNIIGRANDVSKNSGEDFIPMEPLEKAYESSAFVYQIYLHSAFDQDFVVAVIVPKRDTVMTWAKAKGLTANYEELCSSPELLKAVLDDLHEVANKKKLAGYEHIVKAHLTPKPFDSDPEMVTFTGKLRRAGVAAKFKQCIESMYKK